MISHSLSISTVKYVVYVDELRTYNLLPSYLTCLFFVFSNYYVLVGTTKST